eukprot:CAMPEP_0115136026 /NCGR_PEP_ID=MMETSP0227-20121206/56115_1 /TAXON_ID=89957 /ORGANISM="Polarella glacialis, Strain CCMP 1383" /LENGTH=920 /DNA_ID=CAMNT_0002542955 /DNA_START=58 /DNA_END=2821 /DNA_ORIENTATION=+
MGCGAAIGFSKGKGDTRKDDYSSVTPKGTVSLNNLIASGDRTGDAPEAEPENEPPGTRSEVRRRAQVKRPVRIPTSGRGKPPTQMEEQCLSDVSPENRWFLNKVLQKHFLFAGLEDSERDLVIQYMSPTTVQTGEKVFSQGDAGDCCYIIQSGVFTVIIDDEHLKQLKSKHSFGELALIYNCNRTASVSCGSEGVLWKMDGDGFRFSMEKMSQKHLHRAMNFFQYDPTFSHLTEQERNGLAGACTVQVFSAADEIMREGEVGNWMFIVVEGTVQTVDQFGNSAKATAGTLLGSAAVMYTKQQILGARAVDNVTCLAVGKCAIERLLGPVEKVLRRSAIKFLLLNVTSGDLGFFKQLSDHQQNLLVDTFKEACFSQGDVIVTAGARAQLIIVRDGEVAVLKATPADRPGLDTAQFLRETAVEILKPGQVYGATPMVNNSTMQHSLVALGVTRIHRVGTAMVVKVLEEELSEVIRLNEIKKVLGGIFLFKNLQSEQMDRVVRSLECKSFLQGSTVVQQGEEATHFWLIQQGLIGVFKDGERLRNLLRWDYFGERGLLLHERRSATCKAEEDSMCLCLHKDVFADIVGTFRKELEHRMMLQDVQINMEDLKTKAVVGRGAFGIVKLVHHRSDTNIMYALKCLSKKRVVRTGQQHPTVMEREINSQCYHPCIMHFITTLQDKTHVYFLTEFLGGGDLFTSIREIGNLTKEQSMFYSGSIALALEYLHARSIMYRDLKPENVLLDFNGFAKLVDFGCCKKALRTASLVGTPEYFAPEAIIGKGYTCAIDWWTLGVMMHEFIVGPLPFGRDTEDQLELLRQIMEDPLFFPSYVDDESAISVVSGLLERTPELRLGASSRGAKEIKEHAYFASFDWDGIVGRTLRVPWVPDVKRLQDHWLEEETLSKSSDNDESELDPSDEIWCAEF